MHANFRRTYRRVQFGVTAEYDTDFRSPQKTSDPEGHVMAHRFTIGVEEEFQIIDPATCELRSHVSQLVSEASPDIAEQVKHELHQSIVETGTRICDNVSELRIEMHRTRGELVAAAERAACPTSKLPST